MNSEPLVSVILPTRNRGATLPESIESVLGQSYRRLELLVVDDASTDDTPRLVGGLSDPRVRLFGLRQCAGASGARNAGIGEARGEWIAFQDSDDLWLPSKLEKQIACAQSHPCVPCAVYTSYWREAGGRRRLLPKPGPGMEGHVLPRLLRGNFISAQTLMARAEEVRAIGGFDAALPSLNDWDFAIRLAGQGQVAWVREALTVYRLQGDSLTLSLDRFVFSYESLLRKHAVSMADDKRSAAWHWAVIGCRLCREGDAGRGRRYLARAWKLRPWDARYAGAWLLSLGRKVSAVR